MKKQNRFVVTEELIGKYINEVLYSDIDPVGKIVGIKGKTKVIIRPIEASKNKTEMEFVVGGFSAHCINDCNQEYDFHEADYTIEVRLTYSQMKENHWKIHDMPRKKYDFNF